MEEFFLPLNLTKNIPVFFNSYFELAKHLSKVEVLSNACSFLAEPQKKPIVEKDQKGQEWIVEWWPQEGPLSSHYEAESNPQKPKRKLLRCSGCKQALYCSQNCQKLDWNVSVFLQNSTSKSTFLCKPRI